MYLIYMIKIKNVLKNKKHFTKLFTEKVNIKKDLNTPVPFYSSDKFAKNLSVLYTITNLPMFTMSLYLLSESNFMSFYAFDIARLTIRGSVFSQFIIGSVQFSHIALKLEENYKAELKEVISNQNKTSTMEDLETKYDNLVYKNTLYVFLPAVMNFILSNILLNTNVLTLQFSSFIFISMLSSNVLMITNNIKTSKTTPSFYKVNTLAIMINIVVLVLMFLFTINKTSSGINPFKRLKDLNRLEGINHKLEIEQDEVSSKDTDIEEIYTGDLSDEQILKLESILNDDK